MVNFGYRREQNNDGLQIEIVIRDESMRKIEVLKCRSKDFHKIANILYKKYGIRYKPEIPKPLGIKRDRDLDWSSSNHNI